MIPPKSSVFPGRLSSLIACVVALSCLPPAVFARPVMPTKKGAQATRGKTSPASRSKAGKAAPSPAMLVKAGKLKAFWNPKDIAQVPTVSAPSLVLMDFDTGEILYSVNPDTKRYPASTTKILTGLLFAENTQPGDIVRCNNARISDVGESSLHIKPGESFSSRDLLYGFLLRSANDGGVVIAEHVAGSVASFADKMNERASRAGATNSHFTNPHGLHDPNHYTTARDLAMIAREAMKNARFADAVRTPRRKISRSINARDNIVVAKSKKPFYDRVLGADGIKTGYTRPAGHCFVGSVTRDGRRLIAVILDAPSSACDDTAPLISWGFARFGSQVVATKGQVLGTSGVRGGVAAAVPVVAGATLRAPFDRLSPRKFQFALRFNDVSAPIKAGDVVGQVDAIEVLEAGTVNSRTINTVPMLAGADVAASPVSSVSRATKSGSLPWVLAGGVGAALLIGYRHGTSTKGARRRRRRFPS